MTPRLVRSPLLAALACAGLLAGCGGGGDPADYIQRVQTVQQRTEGEARRLSAEMEKASTAEQIGTKLDELGTAVRRNAAELDRIEAPEEVTAQHRAYAKLMGDYGNSLRSYADRVEGATPETINEVFDEAGKLTQNLSTRERELITEINERLQR